MWYEIRELVQIEDGGVNSAISFMQVSWKENRNSDLGEKKPSVWHLLLSYLGVRLQAQPILQERKIFQLRRFNISITKENPDISTLDHPTFVIFV